MVRVKTFASLFLPDLPTRTHCSISSSQTFVALLQAVAIKILTIPTKQENNFALEVKAFIPPVNRKNRNPRSPRKRNVRSFVLTVEESNCAHPVENIYVLRTFFKASFLSLFILFVQSLTPLFY